MPETLAAGKVISHYRILSLIGTGGMGEVYLAEDPRLGRRVAIKLLPPDIARNESRLRRFEQEARAASALNHPNIITIFEIGHADAHSFIVTEFIEGDTLRQRLERRLSLDDLLDVAGQVAGALAAAHQAGIVHRDIKPENIMLRPDGIVKVLDFGLAKLTERSGEQRPVDHESDTMALVTTNPNIIMGTPHYMSPEQARGAKLDGRTDIFSLGVMLYEMATGRVPFDGQTPGDVIAAIIMSEPPPLAAFARHSREWPRELDRIVSKALRKDREERYQTIKDMALDLKRLRQDLEFEQQFERSRRSFDSDDRQPPARSSRETVAEFNTDPAGPARRESSAEYLLNGLRRHRKAVSFALMGTVLALAAVFYVSRTNFFQPADPPIEYLAVLPFANMGNDTQVGALADGIAESLRQSLDDIPRVRVAALSAVQRFKSGEADPRAVGRDLGVLAVLTGQVSRQDDALAIYVEMVDTRDSSRIWSQQYSRRVADFLTAQEEITREVGQRLRLQLSDVEKARFEAIQLYLKGRHYLNKRRPDDLKKGVEEFAAACQRDPNYGPAYAGLADSYSMLAVYGALTPGEAFPKAREAAERALQLDEKPAEAYSSLGVIFNRYEYNWEEADAAFRRAIELKPNYAPARQFYSNLLVGVGRTEDAIAEAEETRRLDPLSLIINAHLGWIYYNAHRYDRAVEQCRKTLEIDPNFFAARRYLALALEQLEKYDEAIAEFKRARQYSGDHPGLLAALGHAYAKAGNKDEALRVRDQLLAMAQRRRVPPYDLAVLYTGLDDKEQAIKHLEAAYRERSEYLAYMNVDPRFEPLRDHPRFADLRRELKLQ